MGIDKKNKKEEMQNIQKKGIISQDFLKNDIWKALKNKRISIMNYIYRLIFQNILTQDQLSIIQTDSSSFYKWYNYSKDEIEAHHHYKRWTIIRKIECFINDASEENRNITNTEIIESIRPELVTLPTREKIKMVLLINKIVKKFNTIHKYTDFKNWPYKSPKELLCAMRWIRKSKIKNNITNDIKIKQYWLSIFFFIWDKRSYQIIYDWSLTDSWIKSWWLNDPDSEIPELKWTLSIINWDDSFIEWIIHEWQHNWNSYFMPDKAYIITHHVAAAKDEIIAFLSNWAWIDEIKEILTKPENEAYKYELEWIIRERHKEKVKELIWYAKDLMELSEHKEIWLTKYIIIQILSDTPRKKRKKLHTHFMKAKNSSNSNEFRWSWTAERDAEIEEINLATSIDEIKYILKNPKYSHIPRWPNKKWWIEISAIIDDVINWKLSITYIPIELRHRIKRFIKK